MALTYEPIATTTLGADSANITFSSIPSTYTDLRVSWVLNGATSGNVVMIRFNGDTGANYSYTTLSGNGSSVGSTRGTSGNNIGLTWNASASTSIPQFFTVDVMSYAGSTYKTCLATSSTDTNGSGATEVTVGLWRSTSAINSITLFVNTANLKTGTTATIYGIKAA